MSGAIKKVTSNYALFIPRFDSPNWAQSMERNFEIIDASIFAASGLGNIVGVWGNGLTYQEGDRVFGGENNSLWQATQTHVSANTGTFLEDRTARPQLWQAVSSKNVYRGIWQPDTQYLPNEFVSTIDFKYGVVVDKYMSGASYEDDVMAGNIITLIDMNEPLQEAFTARDRAVLVETNSKSSEINSKLSETNAKTHETNSANSALTATTQAGIATNAATLSTQNKDATAADLVNTTADRIATAADVVTTSGHVNRAVLAETNAETSETNSKTSETKAKTSETNAKTSETNSATHETNSANSATAASQSETNAKTSETNAKTSETAASTSASTASSAATTATNAASTATTKASEASTSAANAKTSETKSKTSETNSKNSETAAATSASNAATSEGKAKTSETNSKNSETAAKTSETNSKTSETNASSSATSASNSASTAVTAAGNASSSATTATTQAGIAVGAASDASDFADDSHDSALLAEQWANEPENVPVIAGKYSAYHWSRKAEEWADAAAAGGVSSVGLSVPEGFTQTVTITSSGVLELKYDIGYQGYTTAEANKLAGIAAGADVTPANAFATAAQGTKADNAVPSSRITISTADPSGGVDGDIWFKV